MYLIRITALYDSKYNVRRFTVIAVIESLKKKKLRSVAHISRDAPSIGTIAIIGQY